LPHCDFPGLVQSITYRLADSLPAAVLENARQGLEELPRERRDPELRRRLEKWLDPGRGCCALRDPRTAECVVETWKRFAPERYDLIAWVVMPNHVHVLIRVREGWQLGRIVQSWKSYTGRRIKDADLGRHLSKGAWMRDYWDRYVRNEAHFAAIVDYIHRNPVKAGLAARPEDWLWSSAMDFARNSESAQPWIDELSSEQPPP